MLTFESIEQAQSFLGRPLTYLETLWFNYSAKMPDFLLYCHSFLFVFFIFCVAPLPMMFADIYKWKIFQKYKLQPKVYVTKSEILQCYKSAVFVFVAVVAPIQIASFPTIKTVGIRTSLPLPSIWEVIAQLAVYYMLDDYGWYWIHRWLHTEWGYEKIHKKHHEFSAPIGFASGYGHCVEIGLVGIPSFVGPAIAPCHMITFWLWISLKLMVALESHSGHSFPWNPTKLIPFYGGADYHDYHHYIGDRSKCNFASIFTYCDYIYGTNKGYRYQRNILLKAHKSYLNDVMMEYESAQSNNLD